MLRNKTALISLVIVLVVIKFGLLPLQQAQQDLHQQLTGLDKRLQRSQNLLQQTDTLQQWQSSQQQQLQQLLQPFPQVASAAQYRLLLQQQLQQLAAANNVSVTFFDWLTDTPLGVFSLQRGRISLRLEGDAANIMLLHLKLEQQFPHFVLRDIRASWRGALSPGSRIELTLLIEADYRVVEAV